MFKLGMVLLLLMGSIRGNSMTAESKKNLIIEMLIRDRLNKGDSLTRASAFAGNAMQESGGDPTRKQLDSTDSDEEWFKKSKAGRGTGLFQWDDRRFNLKKFANKQDSHWSDIDAQLDFLQHELLTSEKRNIGKVTNKDNVEQQTKDISKYFLRPGKPHNKKRISYAKKFKKKFKNIPQEIKETKLKSSMFDSRVLAKKAAVKKLKQEVSEQEVSEKDIKMKRYNELLKALKEGKISNAAFQSALSIENISF